MAPKISYFLYYMFFLSLAIAHPSHSNLQHFNNEESSPPPFQFLKDLHGSVKGNIVGGINKLKSYLKTFGYLRNQAYRDNNIFDDDLENAVKSYQRFYGLNTTGRLDDGTVSLMMMPRCGVPDYSDGSSPMLHQHGPESPHFGPDYAFFPGKLRWTSKRNFTYSFQPSSRADVLPPIANAFKKWSVETPLGFTFTYTKDYNAADLKLSFQRRAHGDSQPFDGKYGVTAHGFAPQGGMAHFDEEEDWYLGGAWNVPGNKLDMQTVSMHEIGHILGLQHSQDKNAIMYPITNYGKSRTLAEDDRKGLIALYS